MEDDMRFDSLDTFLIRLRNKQFELQQILNDLAEKKKKLPVGNSEHRKLTLVLRDINKLTTQLESTLVSIADWKDKE